MAFSTIERIKSWSPSRLGDYEQCARKAFYKHVRRLPDPGNQYSNRGIKLHASAEQYVKGAAETFDPELNRVRGFLNHYRAKVAAGKAKSEMKLCFDDTWRVVEWFSHRAWLRIVIDITESLTEDLVEIADWKSGKLKKDNKAYSEQLNLYSVCALSASLFNAVKAQSKLIFVDHGVEVDRPEGTVDIFNLRKQQRSWENRVERMFEDDTFSTNPGWHCKGCPYRKGVGPCEHGVTEIPSDERF